MTPFASAECRTQHEVEMEFLWEVTKFGFLGMVMLIIEYFVIQPRQNAANLSVLKASPEIDESWTVAIQKGLREFRKHQGHSWFPFFGQKVKIEESFANGESAVLTVRVEPRTPVVFLESLLYRLMKVDGMTQDNGGRHRLVIGRLGDIQEISLLEESTIRYTVQLQAWLSMILHVKSEIGIHFYNDNRSEHTNRTGRRHTVARAPTPRDGDSANCG